MAAPAGFRPDVYWRGNAPADSSSQYPHAVYFSKSRGAADWFARSSDKNGSAAPYYIKTTKTASMDDLNRLVGAAIKPQDDAAWSQYNDTINQGLSRGDVKDWHDFERDARRSSGRERISSMHWPRTRSVSYITPYEVQILKSHGYDSIEGKIDGVGMGPGGEHEVAVFSRDQYVPAAVSEQYLVPTMNPRLIASALLEDDPPVRPLPLTNPYHIELEAAGHRLIRDNHGRVDVHQMSDDPHNGPGCERCGETWCHHCKHEIKPCTG